MIRSAPPVLAFVAAPVVAGGAGEELLTGVLVGSAVQGGAQSRGALAAHLDDDGAAARDAQQATLGNLNVKGVVVEAHTGTVLRGPGGGGHA